MRYCYNTKNDQLQNTKTNVHKIATKIRPIKNTEEIIYNIFLNKLHKCSFSERGESHISERT